MKQEAVNLPDVSRETSDRLDAFAALVAQWTARINLIARADIPHLRERHIRDSLQLVPLIPATADRLIDLGAGAGFPGLVIAIARPDLAVTLIESDRRKAAFLTTAIARLGLSARILATRIEQAAIAHAPVVTARALARLPALLDLAAPLCAPDGVCLFPKGRGAEDELTDARRQWHMDVERFRSRTAPDATILRLSRIHRRDAA